MPGLKSADGSRALIMCPQSVENSLRNTLRMASLLNSKSGVHGAPGTLGTRGTHGPLTRPGTRTTLIILSTLSMASISGASSVLAELNSVDALSVLVRLSTLGAPRVLTRLNGQSTRSMGVLDRLEGPFAAGMPDPLRTLLSLNSLGQLEQLDRDAILVLAIDPPGEKRIAQLSWKAA